MAGITDFDAVMLAEVATALAEWPLGTYLQSAPPFSVAFGVERTILRVDQIAARRDVRDIRRAVGFEPENKWSHVLVGGDGEPVGLAVSEVGAAGGFEVRRVSRAPVLSARVARVFVEVERRERGSALPSLGPGVRLLVAPEYFVSGLWLGHEAGRRRGPPAGTMIQLFPADDDFDHTLYAGGREFVSDVRMIPARLWLARLLRRGPINGAIARG